jgi:hypothetical protein
VTRLSSLFDVPAQLAMLLSLAASTAATDPTVAVAEVAAPAADVATFSEPLEGPLRFSDRTWLRALHENVKEADAQGARVFVTSGGRYYVPPPSDRSHVLATRNNAEFAARIAWAAAARNARRMHTALHRAPMAGDLYIAHVFGAETAISLLDMAARDPDAALERRFPELAGAAPVSADVKGPITVDQFYRRLSGALHEPPRLIAIGLQPTLTAAPRSDPAVEQEVSNTTTADWLATVEVVKADRRTQ